MLCRSGCVFLDTWGLRKSLVPGLQNFIFPVDDKMSFVLVGKWAPRAFPIFLLLGSVGSSSNPCQDSFRSKTWSGKVTKASARLTQAQEEQILYSGVNSEPSSSGSHWLSSVIMWGQVTGEGDIQGPLFSLPVCHRHLHDRARLQAGQLCKSEEIITGLWNLTQMGLTQFSAGIRA